MVLREGAWPAPPALPGVPRESPTAGGGAANQGAARMRMGCTVKFSDMGKCHDVETGRDIRRMFVKCRGGFGKTDRKQSLWE